MEIVQSILWAVSPSVAAGILMYSIMQRRK